MQSNFGLTRSDKGRSKTLVKNLLPWFYENRRDFPWRSRESTTFHRILCEVLLQRTRAETVANVYSNFFTRYPNWQSIYESNIKNLEDTLKPLGIWRRRAQSLKLLSEKMVELKEEYPTQRENIEALPAVGQYVANAIELFDQDLPKPLIDTNMARIIERYFRPRKLADIRYDPWLQKLSHFIVDQSDPTDINWALLDLGAMICKPRNPSCLECPINRGCSYRKSKIK